MDKALHTMTGRTPADFSPGDESDLAYLRRQLSVVIDQGSDGWSVMFYVLYKLKLRAVLKFDISTVNITTCQGQSRHQVCGRVASSVEWFTI